MPDDKCSKYLFVGSLIDFVRLNSSHEVHQNILFRCCPHNILFRYPQVP